MGLLNRKSFAGGWAPDVDAVNAPKDVLLRADNGILDELGALTGRQGSAKINGSPFSDVDVHSLFTAILSGTRYRMAGATAAVYANGSSISSGLAGSNEVSFGSYLGQIFWARSTSKSKYDGSTVRNWGIAMTGTAPTIVAIAPDEKVFATCDTGESPGLTAVEGSLAFVTGQDGTASGAAQSTPNATTGRGVLSKTFSGATDFTSYTGGQTGTDNDLMQLYVYVTEPQSLIGFDVMVDVNSSSTNLFQDDYYIATIDNSTVIDTAPASTRSATVLNAFRRKQLSDEQIAAGVDPPLAFEAVIPSTQLRPDAPVSNAGWNKVLIPKTHFTRVGNTTGKSWATVIAIRLVVRTVGGGASAAVAFDAIKFIGGNLSPLTGQYQWIYCYAYNTGTYTALSAPSAASAITTMQVNGATVTAPSDSSRDSQVNEIWLFRFGGPTPEYMRVVLKTGVSGTGSVAITDTTSDTDALITDIPLEIDNAVPPDSIIDIAGPYFNRLFALTRTKLYPSRRLNPESFSSAQQIRIAGVDETAYWVKKAYGGLYIGTSRDVYRLDGDGAELPDDTINFTLTPLNVDHPPVDNSQAYPSPVAQEGSTLVYLADDGWRSLNQGGASESLTGLTSLLYRGYTRHGVSPANLATGRFKAALAKDQLVCLVPEGASTTKSTVLHRRSIVNGRVVWYRHVYTANWRSLYREPDGTLIAGDDAGTVWTLDTGTQDAGSSYPLTVWTPVDDDDLPFQRKDPLDHRMVIDTGNQTATLAIHLDNSGSAAYSPTFAVNGLGTYIAQLAAQGSMATFRQIQYRLTVTTNAFRLNQYGIGYRERPALQTYAENKPELPSPSRRRFGGMKLVIDTLSANATVTPILDGSAGTPWTVNTSDAFAKTQTFAGTIARDLWVKIASSTGFELYQVEPHIIETFPPVTVGRLPSTNAGWAGRKRLSGLKVKFCSLGAAKIITPILDGSIFGTSYTITTNTNNPETHLLQFAAPQFNTDIAISSDGEIETYEIEPQVELQIPVPTQGRLPPTNVGYAGPKVMAGIELKLCTLNTARVITVYLDGTAQSTTYSFTTGANEPETKIIKFAAPLTATDIAIGSDGDIELYGEIQPQVLYTLPVGVYAWENIPLQRSNVRRRFGGFALHLNTGGANATLTPVLDGVDQDTITVNTSAMLSTVKTIDSVVGRDLWCRITSSTAMQILSVESIVLETFPQQFKGLTPRNRFGYDGIKTVSGYQVRVCTIGAAVNLTPVIDGEEQDALSVQSEEDDPTDVTIQFDASQEGIEFSLLTDANIELFAWTPIITAKRPLGVKTWDSGPIDIGAQELVWLREMFLKVRATDDLNITPWIDGQRFETVTVTPSMLSADTIVPVPIGRAYVGRQPRLVITSDGEFFPYWIKVRARNSGLRSDKPTVTVPVTLAVLA